MTAWEALLAFGIGTSLTFIEVLVRYSEFRGREFKSWICWTFVVANGITPVFVLLFLHASTAPPRVGASSVTLDPLQRLGGVIIATAGALALLRAGSIAKSVESSSRSTNSLSSQPRDAENGVLTSVRSLLQFLITRSDTHVQNIYAEYLTGEAYDLCPEPMWPYPRVSDQLVAMCIELSGISGPVPDEQRRSSFLSDVATIAPQDLDDGQKWLLLLRHCIHYTTMETTRRAIATLT